MPSNENFGFEVLIGNTAVAEYNKDGRCFIECNLYTPVSYQQSVSETVNGEDETQSWPVTPYVIRLYSQPGNDGTYYYKVFVDGMKVKGASLDPGESRMVRGFRDGTTVRELLFSMPRFATDEADRVEEGRVTRVGQIEVECWHATLQTSEWQVRKKDFVFTQANKKDSYSVTGGQFTMATSKAGRVINPNSEFRCVDHWKRTTLKSRLCVFYRMGTELREMGFKLKPLVIEEPKVKRKLDKKEDKEDIEKKRARGASVDEVVIKTEDAEGASGVSGAGEGSSGGAGVRAIPMDDGEPVMIDLTSDDEEDVCFMGSSRRGEGEGSKEVTDLTDDDVLVDRNEVVFGDLMAGGSSAVDAAGDASVAASGAPVTRSAASTSGSVSEPAKQSSTSQALDGDDSAVLNDDVDSYINYRADQSSVLNTGEVSSGSNDLNDIVNNNANTSELDMTDAEAAAAGIITDTQETVATDNEVVSTDFERATSANTAAVEVANTSNTDVEVANAAIEVASTSNTAIELATAAVAGAASANTAVELTNTDSAAAAAMSDDDEGDQSQSILYFPAQQMTEFEEMLPDSGVSSINNSQAQDSNIDKQLNSEEIDKTYNSTSDNAKNNLSTNSDHNPTIFDGVNSTSVPEFSSLEAEVMWGGAIENQLESWENGEELDDNAEQPTESYTAMLLAGEDMTEDRGSKTNEKNDTN